MPDGSYGAVAYKVRHSETTGEETASVKEKRKSISLQCRPVESANGTSYPVTTVTLHGKFYTFRGKQASWLPDDPGAAGKKTMLGIDSDKDCVRDDIERLIAGLLPASNQKKARKYMFEYAKWRGEFLRDHYVDDRETLKEISRNLYTAGECVQRILNDDVKSKEIIDRVFSKFHNTYSRSYRYIDNNALLDGWSTREIISVSCP